MAEYDESQAKMMIFAGAGASAALNIPTTVQFINNLEKYGFTGNLLETYISSVCETQNKIRKDVPVDSEYVRDWLIDLASYGQTIENLSTNASMPPKMPEAKHGKLKIDSIRVQFDSAIRKAYGKVNSGSAYSHYFPLLNILEKYQQGIEHIPVFTTNYDLVFESLHDFKNSKWNIETGFRPGMYTILEYDRFLHPIGKPSLLLYKLHGSIDWWLNSKENGRVERIPIDYTQPSDYEELLIYPTREKFDKVKKPPFSFFYTALDRYLSSKNMKLCIAIGYSFRDQIINEKFANAVQRGLKLTVFDNKLKIESLVKELKLESIRNSVRIIPTEFGVWGKAENRTQFEKTLSEEITVLSNSQK